jgi:hypothetical protein
VDEKGQFTVSVLLIFRQKKTIPPIKIMQMLASSLHLIKAPPTGFHFILCGTLSYVAV